MRLILQSVSKRTIILGLAALGLAACAAGNGAAAKMTISPCTSVRNPVWSPDGTQIAYYGTRWPKPKNHSPSNDLLQAFCTMDVNGKNSQPIRYTVCSEGCADFPYQIAWLPSGELVYDIDGGPLYRLTPGQKPKRFATVNSPSFATDTTGDRLAVGWAFPGCLSCGGPVTILDFPSGHVVGKVGGKKFQNDYPSLSPDGSQVAFERDGADNSGRIFGIWTANTNGSNLRRLVKVGQQPLWSPSAGEIAYSSSETTSSGLRLIRSQGGKYKTLVPRGVTAVFGWSPDGTQIAYETGSKLRVVNVATRKVRQLRGLYSSSTVVWSPDSQTLLADSWPIPQPKGCSAVWLVPVSGGKPTLIHHC